MSVFKNNSVVTGGDVLRMFRLANVISGFM